MNKDFWKKATITALMSGVFSTICTIVIMGVVILLDEKERHSLQNDEMQEDSIVEVNEAIIGDSIVDYKPQKLPSGYIGPEK